MDAADRWLLKKQKEQKRQMRKKRVNKKHRQQKILAQDRTQNEYGYSRVMKRLRRIRDEY